MYVDAKDEKYENKLTGGKYDNKDTALNLRSNVFSGGSLSITGDDGELKTQNLSGYNQDTKKQTASATLHFGSNGLRQDYRYGYSWQDNSQIATTQQSVSANIFKDITQALTLKGGLNYSDTDFESKTTSSSSYLYTTGNVLGGVLYHEQYRPNFLGPFGFTTNYEVSYGTSTLKNKATGISSNGAYEDNNLYLAFDSLGWVQDYFGVSYTYDKQRDQSSLGITNELRKVVVRFKTTMIPRTVIDGTIDYSNRDSQSNDPTGGYLTGSASNLNTNGRSTLYTLTVDHALAYYLTLSAGINRTDTLSNDVTLSTLQPVSRSNTQYETDYFKLNYNWMFTRRLTFAAQFRDEWRRTLSDTAAAQNRVQAYLINLNLNYTLRQVVVTLSYDYRQENHNQYTEQTYYLKLTRRF